MNKQLIFQLPTSKLFLTNLIFRNLSNILITILMMFKKGQIHMSKLLLINITDADKIRRLVSPMNIPAETVHPSDFDKTLVSLASARQKETPVPIGTDASIFKDSLLIFCDVPEKSSIKFFSNCASQRFPLTIKLYSLRQIQSGLSKGLCSNLNANMLLLYQCTRDSITLPCASRSAYIFLLLQFKSCKVTFLI